MLVTIKILTWLALPIGILAWSSLIGLLIVWRSKKKFLGRGLIALAIIQLLAFSSPLVSDRLLQGLEDQARAGSSDQQRASLILEGGRYGAIVLLGGGIKPAAPPARTHPDLGDAADRVWHTARLYRQGLAPKIIVSGGLSPGLESRNDIHTEAQAMKSLLIDLGVPSSAITLEEKSRSTRENARYTKAQLGSQTAALVTSAFHMPRSLRTFEREGLTVHGYPTDFRVAPNVEPLWKRLLPNARSLENSEAALKEYISMLVGY